MLALRRRLQLKHNILDPGSINTDRSDSAAQVMDVFELYKPFRNKIAQLSYEDAFYAFWAYSQYLQIESFNIPKDIEVNEEFLKLQPPQQWISEWELEVLAKEVILNGSTVSRKGRTLRSWHTLSAIVNQLKDLENDIYGLYGSDKNIWIELIRIAHRQFVWQGNPPNPVSAIRYFIVYNCDEIDKICKDHIGISVREIYTIGMGLMGVFLSSPAINAPFSSDIHWFSQEKAEKFLSFTCRAMPELKPLLKSEQRYDDRFAYAYSSLRAYPLIRMNFRGSDAIACPLPTLLFWRITGGLYYELLSDCRFAQAYGTSFQKYVGEAIKRACSDHEEHLFAEREYGTKKARKDSVDWIFCDGASALFLECKAKRLSWGAKEALDDLSFLEADIQSMAGAVVQVYKTINDYKDGKYPHFPFVDDRKIYPVIVTFENWRMFGTAMNVRLHDAVAAMLDATDISREVLETMPYSVWPIEDLEVGIQVINVVGVQDFMDGKIVDTEMRQWEWHSYMIHRFPECFPARRLFEREYEEMFSGLIS